jgi:hypothetical protein
LYGALGWGIAMFVASVTDHYLQSRLLGHPAKMSAPWMASELALWLAGGCLFGWMMWGGYRDRHDLSIK